MTAIGDFAKQADLALAAYANVTSGISGKAYTDALQAVGMSSAQATEFSQRWAVIDSVSFPNGAAATIFEEVGKHGVRYLAVRGTEFGVTDIAADAILAAGFPSFVNPQFVALRSQIQTWMDAGKLSANFTVAGHSLGGYLAAAIGSWYRSGTVYMYNAPGVGGVVGNAIDAYKTAFGFGNVALVSDIYNFRGSEGVSVITGLGAQLAPPTMIQIEAAVGGSLGPGNHSVVRQADAFATYALYSTLCPSLTLDQIGSLLKSSSEQNKLTLESALNALRVTLLGKTVVNSAPTVEGDRESFYSNLYTLQKTAEYQVLTNNTSLRLLTEVDRDTLVSKAKTDFGDFLAVRYLLPFALENSWAVLGTIHTALRDEYEADKALTPAERDAGKANYTDQWLKDRSAFLTWMLKANSADTLRLNGTNYGYFDSRNWEFTDLTKNQTITVSGLHDPIDTPNSNKVIFGSDGNDGAITGGTETDYLYGGGGNDVLNGDKGDDYIEGNADDDTLSGGEGHDTLFGGTGADTLEGGKESDILAGGLGADTYKFTSGDGWDWVTDSDGLGRIDYDGLTLGTGSITNKGTGVWQEDQGGKVFTYILTDWTEGGETFKRLSIQGPDGGMWVKAWQPGQLGLNLPGAPAPVVLPIVSPTPSNTATAWYSPAHAIVDGRNLGMVELAAVGDHGEVWGDGRLIGNETDNYLHNGAGDDELYGNGGRDVLIATGGNDKLYGGADDDALQGGADNDYLEGNAGSDVLAGGLGADVLLGGDGDDYLMGGGGYEATRADWSVTRDANQNVVFNQFTGAYGLAGDSADQLLGGAGNDRLWGGEGADQLYGEADNDQLVGSSGGDYLNGGDGADKLFGDGSQSSNPDNYTFPQYHGDDVLDGGEGNDQLLGDGGADELYGGGGNDILLGDADGIPTDYQGADRLDGGSGDDTLYGGGKDDVLLGGDGADKLYGGAQDDELHGGAGNDRLEGDSGTAPAADQGKDTLYGDAGNDTLLGAGGMDILYGGVGDDELYGDADDVPVALQDNDALYGEDGNDYLRGYGGDDTLDGGAGDDELHGSEGNDALTGGAGSNLLFGEDGNDTLTATGADFLNGGAGDDTYLIDTSNATILDNTGTNTIRLLRAATMSDVTISNVVEGLALTYGSNVLLLKDAEAGTLPTLVAADGSTFDPAAITAHISKHLQGGTTNDVLEGGLGNDELFGLAGYDTLVGGEGNDFLDGGRDLNMLIGGLGNDTYRTTFEQWGWGCLDVIDKIVEAAGEGADTLIAYSYSAILPENVENLKLAPIDWSYSSGGGPRRGLGNSDDNVLDASGYTVMPSAVELDGGEGQDTMIGSDYGGTIFHVDNTGDQVRASGRYNSVISSVEFRLSDGFTNLDLIGESAINGWGNDEDNRLSGNSAASRLIGGLGNDYYILGPGDVAIENEGEGIDTIKQLVGDVREYRVSQDFANIENIAIGLDLGAADLIGDDNNNALTGNAYNNRLVGGGGNDTLVSNGDGTTIYSGGSFLTGNQGNDTLDGGSGDDALIGCKGNETYLFGRGYGADIISDVGGLDTIRFGDGVASIDILLSRQGNDLRIAIAGSEDTLTVSNHFAVPPYGVQYAIDQMEFSDGVVWDHNAINARLAAGNVNTLSELADVIVGSAGEDVINSLDGDDNVSGLGGDDYIDGGSGNDQLFGNAGNDTLIGGGGTDILDGGTGNDTYVFGPVSGGESISVVGDQTRERSINVVRFVEGVSPTDVKAHCYAQYGAGWVGLLVANNYWLSIDGFYSSEYSEYISEFRFEDGTVWSHDEVDTMSRSVFGTADDDVLLGNESYSLLFGFAGNDSLSGYGGNDVLDGGTGMDTLVGSVGNDTYIVDNVGDVVVENSNEGVDLVQSNVTYKLVANVENLTLNETATINGTGNSLNNVLTGNSAANILNGGTGQDTLIGNAGDDTYVVDNALDVVMENMDEGTDLVQSSVTYTLSDNVENLTLIGSTANNGTGNALDNRLTGNSAVNTLTGGAGNDTLNGGTGADMLIGGSGDDTYIVDNAADVVTENSNEGTELVQSSVTYTLAANVENLTLTGSSTINGTGNTLNNVITGNGAANTLDGGVGADTLAGAAGNDTYVIDDVGDVVVENAGEGTDLVQSGITYTLTANVEKLMLTGTSAINGTGNMLANTLTGNSANNLLDGGAGNDTLVGGTGDDTYIVDSTSDLVTEAASAGTDRVLSSATYTLAADVENLTLAGATAINGTGNTLNNVLIGNSAANILDGGTGTDTLTGGLGDDTYVIDVASDVVTENASEGIDLVKSGTTYTLNANVENLTLTGTTAINATGNTLTNVLTGNSGANILDGGAGADTLIGGNGNDTYAVDNVGDVVTEGSSAGTDLVQASVTYTLATNVENLTLTGTAAINGTGNTLANTLTGNSGNNVLDGGTGADTLIGGAGNDTYVVDNLGDVVTEAASAGTDLVRASVTYTLAANVENLTLTGATAINGTGNTLDNVLVGNSAANTLTGGAGNDTLNGGAGADKMLGGLGDDTYTVDNASDVVTENASEGTDLINSSITLTLAANVEALVVTGATAINGTGNALNNLLRGNTGNNVLNGRAGNDILDGGDGNDTLTDTSGTTFFNGGAGTDTITGGASAELFLGGLGNDTYTTGAGNDVILFNRGDGQDTFVAGGTGSDTLSLGGAFAYSDLTFSKTGNDLVLKEGVSDQITFKDWYAATPSKPVVNLQVIAEAMADFAAGGANPLLDQKVERFNFTGLVGAFDAARTATPTLTTWALTNALANFQLAGSDAAALGGDLAYQYGRNGTLAGIGLTAAQDVIGNTSFGTGAQTLQPLAGLQTGAVRLS